MTTTVSQNTREVVVTQADREAAAAYYYSAGGSPVVANEIRDGKKDKWFRVQAFARHRQSAESGEAWRPIETAPKDGARILLFRHGEQYVGRWFPDWNTWGVSAQRQPGQWEPFTDIGCCEMGSTTFWYGPSHWQPLPTPPEAVRTPIEGNPHEQ